MHSIDPVLLIHKELTNQISPKEKKLLKAWLKVGSQNKTFQKEIKMIWKASKKSFDPAHNSTDFPEHISEKQTSPISVDVNDHVLFSEFENIDTKHNRNEASNLTREDLFKNLMLSNLSYAEQDKLSQRNITMGWVSILKVISTIALGLLSRKEMGVSLNVLTIISESTSFHKILISDINQKIRYATDPDLVDQDSGAWMPEESTGYDKLVIFEKGGTQFIAMPIFHQYGRIGVVLLMI